MARRSRLRRVVLCAGGTLVLAYAVIVGLRVLWPINFVDLVAREAARQDVDFDLVASMIYAESRFRPDAVSHRGAIGLMQIMPETGAWIAEQMGLPPPSRAELRDVELNVRLGVWYLRYLLDRFGDLETALQAYNAGPTAAERWRNDGSSPHSETAAYVRRVLSARPIYRLYHRVPILVKITPSVSL